MSEERYKLIKENVYTRCHIAEYTGIGLSCPDKEEIELIDYVEELKDQLQQKENIIKEVREYITSYESIETIQQFDHNKNNKDLDYSTIDEMTRRYMIVHDKILEILDKEGK